MPSQNKLIKQGLKYTDSLFDEISNRLEQGVKASDTLEAFLDKYYKAFPDGNPLLALGYDAEMVKLILSETNNHKFSRPSQKELVRVTIESQVGDLIRDVGEDIRESVRDIVKQGYDENLSQDEIAANISSKVSSIKGRRAKAIARTEIARTATISDYVINAERGATHFYVECRNTACPICKEAWHKHWSKSNDESFTPSDSSAGGKGWIGDKVYSMSDTMMLPPVHPNCRCVPYFISEDDIPEGITVEKPTPKTTTTTTDTESEVLPEPTKEQLRNNLTSSEIKRYKRWQKEIKSKGKFSEDFLQKRIKDLEALKRKALGLPSLNDNQPQTPKPKPTPKQKPKTTTEKKPNTTKTETQKEPTKWDKMSFKELAEHHGASYDGLMKMPEDGKEYHVFREKLDNGKEFRIFVEKGAVNAYQKGGVATINEIVHEVFKVPEVYRKETDQIWFKNTQKGIKLNPRGKLDTLKSNTGGYNTFRSRSLRSAVIKGQSKKFKGYDDPNHRIVINPKSFKKLKSDIDKITWRDKEGETTSWKHIIHHEFAHSIDDSRKIWRDNLEKLHNREEYRAIEEEEPYFTKYANTQPGESFAEHGGYISYMLANPEEQSKKMRIHRYGRDENNRITTLEEEITFEEYKQRYPKHYKYFTNLINGGMNDVVA